MPSSLIHLLKQQKNKPTYWLAFSGGLDSMVLLHLLKTIRETYPINLQAIHVHHGLSQNANAWSQHCKKICREWDVKLITKKITIENIPGESLEALAREKRYEIFANSMKPHDVLLTAHHEDDQAETFLLQLIRGAGPKGLSAMPLQKKFAKGEHWRPLLSFSRAQLKKYAEQYQLTWINDESNQNENFSRNFLRHQVMPVLQQRWPTVQSAFARAAMHCAETEILLQNFLEKKLTEYQGSMSGTLSVNQLLKCDDKEQRAILRVWIQHHQFPLPSTVKIQTIQKTLLHARPDRTPKVHWPMCEVRRYRDDVFIMKPLEKYQGKKIISWDLKKPLVLPGIGVLHAIVDKKITPKNISVRFRENGEKFLTRGRHRTLKNFFQENSIPPWQRDRIPLIFIGETLVAIVGYDAVEDLLPEITFVLS